MEKILRNGGRSPTFLSSARTSLYASVASPSLPCANDNVNHAAWRLQSVNLSSKGSWSIRLGLHSLSRVSKRRNIDSVTAINGDLRGRNRHSILISFSSRFAMSLFRKSTPSYEASSREITWKEFCCLRPIFAGGTNDRFRDRVTRRSKIEKIVADPLYERHVGRPEFRSKGGDKKLLVYFPWRCRGNVVRLRVSWQPAARQRLDRFQGRRSGLTSRNCAGLRVFAPANRL